MDEQHDEIIQFEEGKRRRDKSEKIRKHITFKPEAVGKIQAFANEHVNGNFSAAVEALTLHSLDDDDYKSTITLFGRMMDHRLIQSQNRFAKLISMAAIEAGKASGVADALLMLILSEKAEEFGYDFVDEIRIGHEVPLDRKVRAVAKSVRVNARKAVVQRMKKPLDEVGQIILALDEEQEDFIEAVRAEIAKQSE